MNFMMFIIDQSWRHAVQLFYYTIVENKNYSSNKSMAKPLLLKLYISFLSRGLKLANVSIPCKVKPAHELKKYLRPTSLAYVSNKLKNMTFLAKSSNLSYNMHAIAICVKICVSRLKRKIAMRDYSVMQCRLIQVPQCKHTKTCYNLLRVVRCITELHYL